LHRLGADSQAELDAFCATLSEKQAAKLRQDVERVCRDPSGQLEPKHTLTRKFRDPGKYLGRNVPNGMDVWEFKPNQFRALFVTNLSKGKDRKKIRLVAFLPIKGKRFTTLDDCPWHR
jgi:hypothetical protein